MVAEFAVGAGTPVVPAAPLAGSAPSVCLDAEDMDMGTFLELAQAIGSGALYMVTEEFDPEADTDQPGEVPERIAQRKGQACELRVAFAAAGHGLLHFWEQAAPWYLEWLREQHPSGDHTSEYEEKDRLAAEIAEVMLADEMFRAASPGKRKPRARQLAPEGSDDYVVMTAYRKACQQAEEMAAEEYEPFWERMDELSEEFLASVGYRKASSADGRKRAAGQFLASKGSGFSPPFDVLNELYQKTVELSRQSKGSALF